MVAGTVRYSTMIPVPVATLYPLKYRRRYFWELELDPGAGAVDTAFHAPSARMYAESYSTQYSVVCVCMCLSLTDLEVDNASKERN